MSTFSDILAALRIQEPTSISYDLSDSLNPELDEFKFRLANSTITAHKEWSNFELYKMVKSGRYSMSSQIPCKHCSK